MSRTVDIVTRRQDKYKNKLAPLSSCVEKF